ncbi:MULTISPECIES: NTP transferase domain-containing protein [unclassified Fusibacter]|uniref:nucleotidyltransferase family protein n=1 Tax=unclassified Fusibacter TaxID=2624464 RepID=UPI001012E0DF|nr:MULTISPECIES: nucleotidyltransferase family protein [unclassified Fusibacter]MCK8060383.1 nucleotidyltransferase family protein [Fusibacter sp. A2]NPE20328.1 nucleotidyltransferase family protein [Fusibacter sp. A1]RXV63534.1 nucleotidyltransferase family protein [Fusibacter sp. A1]
MRVEGVILAAGLSSRMGENKLIKPIDFVPMIECVIVNMLAFCDLIFVVVGHRQESLIPILSNYEKVRILLNPEYESGMFSSVVMGCEAIRCDRFFLIPADMPFTQASTYQKMLTVDAQLVVPSYCHRAGHPILISSKVVEGIRDSKVKHLREFLSDTPKVYVVVDDPGILIDIDTPEDYEKYVVEGYR